MKNIQRLLAGFMLMAALMVSSAQAGMLISDFAGDSGSPCSDNTSSLGGMLISDFGGMLISDFTGIILLDVASPQVNCGIYIHGKS